MFNIVRISSLTNNSNESVKSTEYTEILNKSNESMNTNFNDYESMNSKEYNDQSVNITSNYKDSKNNVSNQKITSTVKNNDSEYSILIILFAILYTLIYLSCLSLMILSLFDV